MAFTGCPLSTSFSSFREWTFLNERAIELRGVTRDFSTITRYVRYLSSSVEKCGVGGRERDEGRVVSGRFFFHRVESLLPHPFLPCNTNQFRRVLRLHALRTRWNFFHHPLRSLIPPARVPSSYYPVTKRTESPHNGKRDAKPMFFRVGVASPTDSFCSRKYGSRIIEQERYKSK